MSERMYLYITITQRSDGEEFLAFFKSRGVVTAYSALGRGTAKGKTLDLLGIEQSEKSVHYALLTKSMVDKMCRELSSEMQIDLPNRGIALALPLSSIGGASVLEYYTSGYADSIPKKKKKAEAEEEEEMQAKYELIIAVCEKGGAEIVMDAARAAGAAGGTIVHAKGTGAKYADKFFGLTLAEEKEMIYIISSIKGKKPIMRSIMQNAGIESKAHAVVFSLPVTDTAGFRLFGEKSE